MIVRESVDRYRNLDSDLGWSTIALPKAAAMAELADALDSGSSVQKTWRFDSSWPHDRWKNPGDSPGFFILPWISFCGGCLKQAAT